MPIFWLSEKDNTFPNPSLSNEDGILAVGGDLSPERLLEAYKIGLFPWFNPEDPILWWCPDPRFVLYLEDLKVSKSMKPYLNQNKFTYSMDLAFEEVMRKCGSVKRNKQEGTWISPAMIEGYCELHRQGLAHSVEVYQNDQLIGGLYGVSVGKIFFGESMFATVANASKYALIKLVEFLQKKGFWLIDCQQETAHLASMGAKGISRTDFLKVIDRNKAEPIMKGSWYT